MYVEDEDEVDFILSVPDLPKEGHFAGEWDKIYNPQSIDDMPIHPDYLLEGYGWACQTRLDFDHTAFDPRCKECIDAAIGYIEVGHNEMTYRFDHEGNEYPDTMFSIWVNNVVKRQKEVGIRK